jgi:hypothetical protein
LDKTDVPGDILEFINEKKPGYYIHSEFSSSADLIDLKCTAINIYLMQGNKIQNWDKRFSKFPIINQRRYHISHNSNNNVIYADIKGKDIVGFITCIYNPLKFHQM